MSKHPDTYRELAASQQTETPAGISQADYDAIEDAVMETGRGRWFLKEYARRVRAAETAGLLTALERIESMIARSGANPGSSVGSDATPVAAPAAAPAAPDVVERLAGVAEKLLDVVWYMRERGFDSSVCEAVGSEARGVGEIARKLAAQSGMAEPEPFERELIELKAQPAPQAHFTSAPATPSLAPALPAAAVQPAMAWPAEAEPACMVETITPPDAARQAAAFRHIEAMPASRRLALFV